ncbi:hypothetical protein KSP40_PGU008504 [Platanthera guangdongensis]|uniref:Uncharacterized protein n=1 Tax=Platanthera guangdongensis TaxID=2320717 RepID=A0ABR2N4P4_9ASPA
MVAIDSGEIPAISISIPADFPEGFRLYGGDIRVVGVWFRRGSWIRSPGSTAEIIPSSTRRRQTLARGRIPLAAGLQWPATPRSRHPGVRPRGPRGRPSCVPAPPARGREPHATATALPRPHGREARMTSLPLSALLGRDLSAPIPAPARPAFHG